MATGNQHIIYTAEDIQQYFAGKLTPAAMHAMEKAALDDPFLEEAMEGYALVPAEEWRKSLAVVHTHYQQATTAPAIPYRKPAIYKLWRAAAAVLIIGCSVAIAYYTTRQNYTDKERIAATKAAPEQTEIKQQDINETVPPAIADSLQVGQQQATTSPAAAKDKEKVPVDEAKTEVPAISFDKNDQKATPVQPAPTKAPKMNDLARAVQEEDAIKKAAPVAGRQEAARLNEMEVATAAESKKVAPNLNQFRARVVDAQGAALPFTNISIINEQVGTYADVKGNFNLVAPDSLLNVAIKSAGYLAKQVTLQSGLQQQTITLEEDALALQQNTRIAGNLPAVALRKRAALVADTIINVEPVDGWTNYGTYITNNLVVPEDIRQKKIEGEVELSFEVQRNGAITNIKVDKSLCGDCDEAALRVVKEGPRWKVKKGNKALGKVKVKF